MNRTRRYLLDLIRTGDVPTVADFDEQVFRELSGGRPPTGPVAACRAVRRRVEFEASALGLRVSVWTLDGPHPYRHHDARLAGHVLAHPVDRAPELPVGDTGRDARHRAHEALMAQRHALRPVPGLSASLEGFCGQADGCWPDPEVHGFDAGPRRPRWFDRPRTWADRWGDPVLTVEPYRDALDPAAVVRDLDGLPLDVEVADGVWNDGCVLLLMRPHPEREPLPSVRRPHGDPLGDDRGEFEDLTRALIGAEWTAVEGLRERGPLDRRAVSGIVARCIASDGGTALHWAEARLASGELTGDLDAATLRALIERLRAQFPAYYRGESRMDSVVGAARVRAWRGAFAGVSASVRDTLGNDFSARVYDLEQRHPGIGRVEPRLRLAASWLSELQTEEMYG